jgi:tRNA(Arg) A34 adenosine deaminase TadA
MELTLEQINILKELMISSARKGNLANAASAVDAMGKTVAVSESLVNTNCDATAHAERLLVEQICKERKSAITSGLSMVTVCEPCLMCMSACAQAGYEAIAYIIPAAKYVDKIPWISENTKIDKQELARTFGNPINLIYLGQYEDEFSKVFEQEMTKFLK